MSARMARLVGVCAAAVALAGVLMPLRANADTPTPLPFQSTGGGNVTVGPPLTLVTGQGGAPIGPVTITLVDGTPAKDQVPASVGWDAGDTLTLTLASRPDGTSPICDGTLTAPTVTGTTAASTLYTGITVKAGGSGCGAQTNAQVLTLPAAPADTANTTLTLSGMKITPGASVNGAPIYLVVTASSGAPFGLKSVYDAEWVATVQTATTAVSKVIGAPDSTLAAPIGDINVTDVSGGTIHSSLVFTLAGDDTFASPGKLTGPTGVVIAGPVETPPSSTLTFAVVGTSSADSTYTLSGATVNFGSSPGVHDVTVMTTPTGTSTSTLVGSSTEFAVTADAPRVAGTDRYMTASALFTDTFTDTTRPHAVVVASGLDFPDALSANVLARQLGSGILLTDPSTLSPSVQLELTNDDVDKVYVVGGTAAISNNVVSQIAAIHVLDNPSNPAIIVSRFAGTDRYATNNLIDETAASLLGTGTAQTFSTAIVATGNAFADALAAGPIVYSNDFPLVLTDPNTLPAPALQSLKDLQVKKIIIIGGINAVSAAVEKAITAAGYTVEYRIAGEDRTSTASLIATWAVGGLPQTPTYQPLAAIPGWLANSTTVWIARGDNYADALAAGPVAGTFGQSILLTTSPSVLGPGIPAYFTGQGGNITQLITLGGGSAVAPSVVDSAITALKDPAATPTS